MGYDIYEFRLSARLERHNCLGDIADNEAFERFGNEVVAMIDADPDYRRIFHGRSRMRLIEVGFTVPER